MADLVGLVLTADAGALPRGPKPVARRDPRHERATAVLRDAGCDDVVSAPSLRAGMAGLPEADAVLVVRTSPAPPSRPVLDRVLDAGTDRDVLARATYDGVPGFPVLLGRDHWAAFADSLRRDDGERYLEEHDVAHVPCGDLAAG